MTAPMTADKPAGDLPLIDDLKRHVKELGETTEEGLDIDCAISVIRSQATEITSLRERIAVLEKALGFYADRNNWWTQDSGGSPWNLHVTGDGSMERLGSRCGTYEPKQPGFVHPQFYPDCGDTARQALGETP